jgi:hypothetical protein
MVVVKDEFRYYGRGDTGNRPLTEAEVARLYERRRRTEIDREALLDEAIRNWTYPRHSALAYLYLVARPTLSDEGLLQRSTREGLPVQAVIAHATEVALWPETPASWPVEVWVTLHWEHIP